MTTQRQKRFESSKERRGAKLIITKKNGYQTEGELITVKPNSLLLLSITGRDVSVDIKDVKVIRVVKKSKAGLGAGIGSLAGVGGSVLAGVLIGDVTEGMGVLDWAFIVGLPLVPSCALIGAMLGSLLGTDKTILVEGMTGSEIQETLDKLRKKARIRDYK